MKTLSQHVVGEDIGLLRMVDKHRWAQPFYMYLICAFLRIVFELAMYFKTMVISIFFKVVFVQIRFYTSLPFYYL
jgi:hypothetical protein